MTEDIERHPRCSSVCWRAEAKTSAGSGGVTLLPARFFSPKVVRGSCSGVLEEGHDDDGENEPRGKDVGVLTDQFAIPLARHDASCHVIVRSVHPTLRFSFFLRRFFFLYGYP